MSVRLYEVSKWAVLIETDRGDIRDRVINEFLYTHPGISSASELARLWNEREALGSVEIAPGVWLPHVVLPHWDSVFAVLARAPSDNGYRAWVCLFVGRNAPASQQAAISDLVQLCAQDAFLSSLRVADPHTLLQILTKKTAQITTYLNASNHPSLCGGIMSTLNELLLDGAVELNAHARDWREAITIAGGLLERTGTITPAYTEAMVDSVEANGPYIVVAPGFAFAHARPSSAVKQTALSWVHLAQPVEFGHQKNDPVSLVVALAAVDDSAHTAAMKELAILLADAPRRATIEAADSEAALRQALTAPPRHPSTAAGADTRSSADAGATRGTPTSGAKQGDAAQPSVDDAVASKNKILTVCGNGLGTSLFLKNSLDEVLGAWGWAKYVDVEATDTISAKGRAKEADFLLTSGEIAATLGDVGVPVYVIEDFTNLAEIDAALRELYAV